MKSRTLVFLLLLLVACSGEQAEKKLKPLSPQQMEEVLYDVHLAEAISASHISPGKRQKLQPDKSLNPVLNPRNIPSRQTQKEGGKFKSDELFKSVLKKHNISAEQFQQSVYYYTKKTKEYEAIYQNVLNRLNALKESLGEKIEEQEDDLHKLQRDFH